MSFYLANLLTLAMKYNTSYSSVSAQMANTLLLFVCLALFNIIYIHCAADPSANTGTQPPLTFSFRTTQHRTCRRGRRDLFSALPPPPSPPNNQSTFIISPCAEVPLGADGHHPSSAVTGPVNDASPGWRQPVYKFDISSLQQLLRNVTILQTPQ